MKDGTIKLVHGEGGKHSQELIRDMFYKNFSNPVLEKNDFGGKTILGELDAQILPRIC